MEDKGKIEALEERLRAVEGLGSYPFSDLADLCLVPNIVIPPKFKVPDFDKYKGMTCPKGHLRKVVGPFLSRQLGRGSCSMVYQFGSFPDPIMEGLGNCLH